MSVMDIRVLLADDHVVVREGLRLLIESFEGFQVVAQASDGGEAYRLCRQNQPDVAVLDIHMPVSNGITTTRKIKSEFPDIKILALSFQAQASVIRDAVLAGADGYILKESAGEELIEAIRSVMKGRRYFSHRTAEIMMDTYVFQEIGSLENAGHTLLRGLSDREKQVLQMLAEGHSNIRIADTLSLSSKTVETYRSRIMNKLRLGSFAELIRVAVRAGLVDQDTQ
jgi:two-component system, NarL family, response regulator NreC